MQNRNTKNDVYTLESEIVKKLNILPKVYYGKYIHILKTSYFLQQCF